MNEIFNYLPDPTQYSKPSLWQRDFLQECKRRNLDMDWAHNEVKRIILTSPSLFPDVGKQTKNFLIGLTIGLLFAGGIFVLLLLLPSITNTIRIPAAIIGFAIVIAWRSLMKIH